MQGVYHSVTYLGRVGHVPQKYPRQHEAVRPVNV
jgi:hypothetical protein